MKLRTTLMAIVFTIVCLLAGCASDEQSNTGYSKVDPIPSETAMETFQSNDTQGSEINTAITIPMLKIAIGESHQKRQMALPILLFSQTESHPLVVAFQLTMFSWLPFVLM